MKIQTTLFAATTLALGCALAAGCSAQANASAEASTVPGGDASAHANTEGEANAEGEALADLSDRSEPQADAPLRPVFEHPYDYDYDNDGSYAARAVFARTEPAPEEPSKYAYSFDRDDDGSHAQERKEVNTKDGSQTASAIPLDIDPELAELCKEAKPTFYFEFDSAKLPQQLDEDFENIVSCLQDPQIDNRSIEVVGHADERGTKAYNQALGRERAQTVASELCDHGLSENRVAVVSMGERKADDPEHWDDRRVVIRMK